LNRYGGPEEAAIFNSVGGYFETMGILLEKELIDPELVDNLFSSYFTRYWQKYKSLFFEFREKYDMPQSMEWDEYLYNEIKEIMLKQHPELRDRILNDRTI
jgi:hypothetical protein